MSITVAELIALPHLGLEVVAGIAGLEREVGWAHVCELEDPLPWLEGGELVMTTGMAVPREPGQPAADADRLAGVGAAQRRDGTQARRAPAHTLAYRLRRIEALTGRDLDSPSTTAELWLAIQARALLRQSAQ
jgi:PucR family transcriptional regulator, purine catabolism regulatory protein